MKEKIVKLLTDALPIVDLDSDFENSIFVSSEDMKKHLEAISDCRKKIEDILNYEKQWSKIYNQRQEMEADQGLPHLLSATQRLLQH